MKLWFTPACIMGCSIAMSCGASLAKQSLAVARTTTPAQTAVASQNADRTATAAMGRAAAGKMKIDGAQVSQIAYVDHCHTAFATPSGRIVIDWTKVGNFAPREASGLEVTDLAQPGGSHRMTMPLGHDSDDVQSTIGLMTAHCVR